MNKILSFILPQAFIFGFIVFVIGFIIGFEVTPKAINNYNNVWIETCESFNGTLHIVNSGDYTEWFCITSNLTVIPIKLWIEWRGNVFYG